MGGKGGVVREVREVWVGKGGVEGKEGVVGKGGVV